jgi:hypothetical protein
MIIVEPVAGIRLERPEEPAHLRAALREAVLSGVDWRGGLSDDVCIALSLWERWRLSLEPAGMDRETFLEVAVGYGREIWLWVMGERRWDELLTGLAGRVGRRLSTP